MSSTARNGTASRWRAPGAVAVAVIAVAAVAAGCGGPSRSGRTPEQIFSSVHISPGLFGPSKIGVHIEGQLTGIRSSNVAAYGSGKLLVDVSGVVDIRDSLADVDVDARLGILKAKAHVLVRGSDLWVQIDGTWYFDHSDSPFFYATDSPLRGLSVGLHDLLAETMHARVVGADDVGGHATDHVTGDVDYGAFVRKVAQDLAHSDHGGVPALRTASEVRKLALDVWVGQKDGDVYRAAGSLELATAGTLDDAYYDTGSFTFRLDWQPTSRPSIAAPDHVSPISELPFVGKELGAAAFIGAVAASCTFTVCDSGD